MGVRIRRTFGWRSTVNVYTNPWECSGTKRQHCSKRQEWHGRPAHVSYLHRERKRDRVFSVWAYTPVQTLQPRPGRLHLLSSNHSGSSDNLYSLIIGFYHPKDHGHREGRRGHGMGWGWEWWPSWSLLWGPTLGFLLPEYDPVKVSWISIILWTHPMY